MKIITIKNVLTDTVIHKSPWLVQDYTQEWFDKNIELNSFGKSAFWSRDYLEGAETREVMLSPEIPAREAYTTTGIDGQEYVVPAQDLIPATYTTEFLHPAEYTFEISDDFSQEIAELKSVMIKEVSDQMQLVFQTANENSAQATLTTWQDMIANASAWVGKIGFTSEEQVIAYATPKVSAARDYAAWRIARLMQYEQEKAELLK